MGERHAVDIVVYEDGERKVIGSAIMTSMGVFAGTIDDAARIGLRGKPIGEVSIGFVIPELDKES